MCFMSWTLIIILAVGIINICSPNLTSNSIVVVMEIICLPVSYVVEI